MIIFTHTQLQPRKKICISVWLGGWVSQGVGLDAVDMAEKKESPFPGIELRSSDPLL
jgi:hypothetical protein